MFFSKSRGKTIKWLPLNYIVHGTKALRRFFECNFDYFFLSRSSDFSRGRHSLNKINKVYTHFNYLRWLKFLSNKNGKAKLSLIWDLFSKSLNFSVYVYFLNYNHSHTRIQFKWKGQCLIWICTNECLTDWMTDWVFSLSVFGTSLWFYCATFCENSNTKRFNFRKEDKQLARKLHSQIEIVQS